MVIEPDFVKMEIEEDPEFDMFNTSDESNEQIPSPQPPRLVQPRAPPAAGTVQETVNIAQDFCISFISVI